MSIFLCIKNVFCDKFKEISVKDRHIRKLQSQDVSLIFGLERFYSAVWGWSEVNIWILFLKYDHLSNYLSHKTANATDPTNLVTNQSKNYIKQNNLIKKKKKTSKIFKKMFQNILLCKFLALGQTVFSQ